MPEFDKDYTATGCIGYFPSGISDLAARELPLVIQNMVNPYKEELARKRWMEAVEEF